MDNLNPFDPEYREPERSSDEPTPTPKTRQSTGPVFHPDVVQGSDEWLALRLGLLTASEMKLIITPTLKMASNDKERAHVYELAAQRISKYVEPHYVSDDMLRGIDDEWEARRVYAETYEPVETIGFMTNDRWGFTIGYSPDGLVGEHGLIECKSRRQKFQVQTVIENAALGTAPAEYMIQLQTGLLVSERQWIDFISYSGGLPMITTRIYPDDVMQAAILEAASSFETRVQKVIDAYFDALSGSKPVRAVPTERRVESEMYV